MGDSFYIVYSLIPKDFNGYPMVSPGKTVGIENILLSFDFDIAFNYKLRLLKEKDANNLTRKKQNKSTGSMKDYLKSGGTTGNPNICIDPKIKRGKRGK